MSDEILITLPKLGESIVSATVLHWFKKVGDQVSLDEPLLEVSTDKVNSEIPSPATGIIQEILALPGQEVQVGETLAILSSQKKSEEREWLSPAVLRLIQEKGIDLKDVDQIPKTGEGNRLTKRDVENYCASRASAAVSTERIKMTSMRKAIADNMVRSFYEAPHATLMTEIDVTEIVALIQAHKESFFQKHKAKLTITSFVAFALSRAVRLFPLINSSLDGEMIVMKHFVNLGFAVSVDQGVMMPVIRNCQDLSLTQIACQIALYAEKARNHSLSPDDVTQGSLSLTNFGMTGVQMGIPIIRHPEVAIIGLGAITKQVRVVDLDTMAIRSVMMISLTFDHRILDGIYGCGFLQEVKRCLESVWTLD